MKSHWAGDTTDVGIAADIDNTWYFTATEKNCSQNADMVMMQS